MMGKGKTPIKDFKVSNGNIVDDPKQIEIIRDTIKSKPTLKKLYLETYYKYQKLVERCPSEGLALELGTGGGFVKEVIPDIVTSNIFEQREIDVVADAMTMPFKDNSLRAICMLNVFHHIPNVKKFLIEAQRCLITGGRLLIVDQHPGLISHLIYSFLHDEPYDKKAKNWSFESSGPLSGANGALAWIVFNRDVDKLKHIIPQMSLVKYQPHTLIRYWLAGGLKKWCLLPEATFSLASKLDQLMAKISSDFGSFVDIELTKH